MADKAYSSAGNRAWLWRRGIKAVFPVKEDQRTHRRNRGRRPPAGFDAGWYKKPTPWILIHSRIERVYEKDKRPRPVHLTGSCPFQGCDGLPIWQAFNFVARDLQSQFLPGHTSVANGAARRAVIATTSDHPSQGDARVRRKTAWCGNVVGTDAPNGRKTMSDIDAELGPVDYLVVAFPAGKADFSGEMASELRALMDSNTVRVLDLVLLTKDLDGSVEASELRDADDSEVGQLRAAEADLAVLLAESDVEEIGGVLEPGSTAAVLVWENSWAAPFGAAVRRSGGQLVTSGRIPTQAILAAMEADRAAQAEGA